MVIFRLCPPDVDNDAFLQYYWLFVDRSAAAIRGFTAKFVSPENPPKKMVRQKFAVFNELEHSIKRFIN